MNLLSLVFHRTKTTTLGVILVLFSLSVSAESRTYTLNELLDQAVIDNPVIAISKAQQESAAAGVVTAQSYINPELEFGAGPSRYRVGGQETKYNLAVGLSQPLEYSGLRGARKQFAESNLGVATSGMNVTKIDLRSRVKSAFYSVIQGQQELKLAEADKILLSQIRDKVKLKVDVGEAPKYELIKADTELLAAERDYQSAIVHISEVKAYLRGLVGKSMPSDFEIKGEFPFLDGSKDIQALRQQLSENPQLQQIKALQKSAEAKLSLEEKLINPGLTVKAGFEQDPDINSLRIGLAIPLPVWNKREGQRAEAIANIRQTQALLDDRELSLTRDLDAAYQRYLIAQQQVYAFENGLLLQSETVLKTAEAAYRYGERGILEYLDAQRTYRLVRKDYLAARYDYVSAVLEIERLVGTDLIEIN